MVKRYFIGFLILFLFCSVQGQNQHTIDSLKIRLQQNLHDTDKVKLLNKLAWEFKYLKPDSSVTLSSRALSIAIESKWILGRTSSLSQLGSFKSLKGDYSEALEYFFKALKMSEGLSSSSDKSIQRAGKNETAVILGHIGIVHVYQGKYTKALEYYFRALKMSTHLDEKRSMAINLGNIGNVYRNQGDYPHALENFFKALKVNEELNRKSSIAANYGNIGIVYSEQGDYSKALEYYFKSVKIAEELGNKNYLARNLGNIGNVYVQLSSHTNALKYLSKALKLNEELENKTGAAINLSNIGSIYKTQADSIFNSRYEGRELAMAAKYSIALQQFFKALKMFEELKHKKGIGVILGNIGVIYTKNGKFEDAEKTLQKALTISKEIGANSDTRYHYECLSILYDTTNRPSQAFEAYKMYIIYRDSITNEENTKAQTRTEVKYEYDKAELVKEQEEKEAARLLAERTSRRDNLQYSVILLSLLILGSLVLGLGKLSLPIKAAEGLIFFSFLILFEFLLVLADPYIEGWSGGAPGIKLLFNAGIAALIFPAHAFFEARIKRRLVKNRTG